MSLPLIISTWACGKAANDKAASILSDGGDLIDAIEKGINVVELDPNERNVGYGSIPNEAGILQLDAAIIDGRTHEMGAVGALEKIATPISVARRVMEKTKHVLICGEGALQFAIREGFKSQELVTQEALNIWKQRKDAGENFWKDHDTITMIILDSNGDFGAGGSTSGLGLKIPGRVSDVSVIGAGLYVDNPVGAAVATGVGDEIMKYGMSIMVVERMRSGLGPQESCESVLRWALSKNPLNKDTSISLLAVNKNGEYGASSLLANHFQYALWTPETSEIRIAASVATSTKSKNTTNHIV